MIIKHKRNMDVAYLLQARKSEEPNTWTCQIVNMGYVKSFFIHDTCEINIDTINKSDWEVCENDKLDCIRYATWRPLSERK